MLKVNFLSDFYQFKNYIGVNGALVATISQAKVMEEYVEVIFNEHGKDYDIIHSHGCFPYTSWLLKKGIRLNKSVVISAHQTHHDLDGSFPFSKKISQMFKLYLRRYYRHGDVLICPTKNSKRIVKKELKINKPIKVISNGVDTQIFRYSHEKRLQFRKKHNLNKPTVLAVGMPTKRKGFFDFIKISKLLNKYHFIWVGKRAFPLIQPNYNINFNNLIMPGYVEDIIAAYSSGDIFCFPSYYEGEGIAILEAISCGLPIIIRDLPVYEGRFFDGKNCLKASNNKEFVENINYLIENPNECRKITRSGLKTAKKFDIKRTGKLIYETYIELFNCY
ncbi:MAG: glycosyltransferase family 4 protein [Candidatus Hermodarchaeota archaeon]